MHGADVVLPLEGLDREAAVFALARQPVLEDDHGGHHVLALEVGDVEALDAQGRTVEVQGLGDLLQGPGAGGEVGGALGLVQGQGLLGVAVDGLHQRPLVPALRNAQAHLGAAPPGEPLAERGRVLGQYRDQHLLGHGLAALLAVQLLEGVLDEPGRVDGLDLVGDPAALAADPAAADVEDLHGRLQLVLGDGDQIGVGGIGEHDRVLLHGPAQGPYVVAQPGGLLVLHLFGGLVHLRFQPGEVGPGPAGHEVAEVLGQFAVLLGGDPADAGGGALADVAEQAGAADLRGALEHARGAGPDREHPEHQVHGLADRPGVGVRPEVPHALLLRPAHDLDPRVLLVHGHGEGGVALVVPVLDVEPGVVLLDPGVLQLERLDLGGHHRPLDGGGGGHHGGGPRMQPGDVLEVIGQALAQALGLPDVDHPAVLVAEPVDTRGVGDLSRLGSVAGRVGHANHPTGGGRQRGPPGPAPRQGGGEPRDRPPRPAAAGPGCTSGDAVHCERAGADQVHRATPSPANAYARHPQPRRRLRPPLPAPPAHAPATPSPAGV